MRAVRVGLLVGFAAGAVGPANAALVISQGATSSVTCAAGACVATAPNAVLNVKDLKKLLKQADLTVASGAAAMDIRVSAKFDWARPHRLTLDSFRSIQFTEAVTSQGSGGMTLTTNDGGSGGDLTFSGQGKVAFWDTANSLVINGAAYTLVNNLAGLAAQVTANPSGRYALAVTYDASMDGTYASAPVNMVFTGTFEGLGHVVDKLTINAPTKSNIGLFAEIGSDGSARDLKLTNVDIRNGAGGEKHGHGVLGGLAGVNAGAIAHVSASGAVHASGKGARAGGLVGINQGTIEYSSAAVTVSAGSNPDAGGLVGWNMNSIVASSASGNVSVGTAFLHGTGGGLVGLNGGSIALSHATGNVEGNGGWNGGVHFPYEDLGGLVGNGGNISQSFATGNVTGDAYTHTGGLVGYNSSVHDLATDSYALGAVHCEGDCDTGGLYGGSAHRIATSYSTGAVTGGGGAGKGGFIGRDFSSGNLAEDYWDLDTSGVSDPAHGAGNIANDPGIAGLTDAELKSGLPAGFDPGVWGQNAAINDGYPYLLANPPA
jgi:hypothetical protein